MICTEEDEFIRQNLEGQTRWICTLNDGTKVYQDDDRPGLEENSAWLRLREHCLKTGSYIVSMALQFRSHVETLPEGAEGYYFVKSILGSFGTTKNQHFFVVGAVQEGILTVYRYKIPELFITETEIRELNFKDPCLIHKDLGNERKD